jgi:hypothetical protein
MAHAEQVEVYRNHVVGTRQPASVVSRVTALSSRQMKIGTEYSLTTIPAIQLILRVMLFILRAKQQKQFGDADRLGQDDEDSHEDDQVHGWLDARSSM